LSHFNWLAPCKGFQDSLGIWIPRNGFWIPDFLSVELKFQIPFISGIPDSLSCILDSKAKDLGFHKQKFPRFWIEKKRKNYLDSRDRFPYLGLISGLQRPSGLVIFLVATVCETLDNSFMPQMVMKGG